MCSRWVILYSYHTNSPADEITLNSEPYLLDWCQVVFCPLIPSNTLRIQQICCLSHHSENTGETFVKLYLKLVCRLKLYTKAEYCLNISLYRSILRWYNFFSKSSSNLHPTLITNESGCHLVNQNQILAKRDRIYLFWMDNIPTQGRKLSQQNSTKAQRLPTTILYMQTIDTRVWFLGMAHWLWLPAKWGTNSLMRYKHHSLTPSSRTAYKQAMLHRSSLATTTSFQTAVSLCSHNRYTMQTWDTHTSKPKRK